MPKKQKALLHREQPALLQALPPVLPPDLPIDALVHGFQSLGFRQILPSAVAEREFFAEHPEFCEVWDTPLREVAGNEGGGEGLVLAPSHVFYTLRKYREMLREREPFVAKWFYAAPILEKNSGRFTQNHELGVFILGEDSGLAHAHLIYALGHVFSALGLERYGVDLTSLGCSTCQKDYRRVLQDNLGHLSAQFCETCRLNLKDDPLQVWTCRNVDCRSLLADIPQLLDFLDESCRQTFASVLETLDALDIPYLLNSGLGGKMFREDVLFQLIAEAERKLIGSGGNLSPWLSRLMRAGESEIPGIGFVSRLEDFWPLIAPEKLASASPSLETFVIALGEAASRKAMILCRELLREGIRIGEAVLGDGSIKNQLKEALSRRAEIALIIGQKEALDETVILRDLRGGMQELFTTDRIIEEVKKRLGR